MMLKPSLITCMSLALFLCALPVRATEIQETMVASLQQIPLPKSDISREKAFVHKTIKPENPGKKTFILMHGSGGDETTLVSLAEKIAPDATLIGIRGRIIQDGTKRWYARLSPTEFDQQDVRAEAAALVSFLKEMAQTQQIDLKAVTFLGYSNGANLIAALTQLYPGFIHEAVLLRPMPVLSELPKVDLSQTRLLTIAGENDKLYFPFASKLEALLRSCGAIVDAKTINSDHGIVDEDARIAAEWLNRTIK